MLTAEPDPTVPAKVLDDYNSRSQRTHIAALRQLQQLQQAKLGRPARNADVVVRVSRDANVPQLAWLCVVSRNGHDFTLGSGVERGPRSVFEGVWDGEFSAQAFHRSQYVYGSGPSGTGMSFSCLPSTAGNISTSSRIGLPEGPSSPTRSTMPSPRPA